MSKVLELVRGNGVSVISAVYDNTYDIQQYNPFETERDPLVLPFENETFTGVFAYFILNAYGWRDSLKIVTEWVRVLKPEGLLHILVPSQKYLGKLMQQVTVQPQMRPLLFGDQSGYLGSLNLSSYNMLDLRVHLEATGLVVVTAKASPYEVALGDKKYDAEQLYVVGKKN